jgi:hypothetical protein
LTFGHHDSALASNRYEKQLPHDGCEFEYRIKSANEEHERVAREDELTRRRGALYDLTVDFQGSRPVENVPPVPKTPVLLDGVERVGNR